MTDNIPDVEDGDSMPFDSISLSYGSRYSDSQPIVSAVNADQLYYKNAMTPKARQKTEISDTKRQLHRVRRNEHDPLLGEEDPVWPIWRVYTRIGSISQQREQRVWADGQEAARGLPSHKAKRLVRRLGSRRKCWRPRQFDRRGDITFKIGKKSKRFLFMCPSPPMAEDAVESFSVSPLNKKLIVPEVNADGTATRRPPDPNEIILQGESEEEEAKRQ